MTVAVHILPCDPIWKTVSGVASTPARRLANPAATVVTVAVVKHPDRGAGHVVLLDEGGEPGLEVGRAS